MVIALIGLTARLVGLDSVPPAGAAADSPPAAALKVTPNSGNTPLVVTADASASTDTDATPIANYTFDFGDGSAAVGPQLGPGAAHTYTNAGTHLVRVTVTDTAGLSSQATANVTSHNGPPPPIAVKVGYADTHHVTSWPFPSPWMGSPNTVFVGVPDSSSGGWDASAIRIDNTSAAPLTGVTVTVDMGGHNFAIWGTNTIPAGQSLILTQTAFANFDGSDTSPAGCFGCDPTLCTTQVSNAIPVIHATIGGVTTDFSDTGQVLNTGGVDSSGCPPTGNRNDETIGWLPVGSPTPPSDAAPSVALHVAPNTGAPPLAITADASGSTDPDFTKIASYRFDFGDGTPAVGPQITSTATHTYPNAGTYPVTVTVTDSGGLSASAFTQVVVTTGPPPTTTTSSTTTTTVPSTTTTTVPSTTTTTVPSTTTTTVPPTTTTTVPPTTTTSSTTTTTVPPTTTTSSTTTTTTLPPPSFGYFGRVASATSSATATKVVLTTTGAVPAGNSLIISLLLSSTTSPTTGAVSATDSVGNHYSIDQDVNDGSAGDRHLVISGLKLATALPAGATVTLNFPSSAEYHASVDEFSGLSARDQHVGASASAPAFSAGPTPTTTQANELLFGAVGTESGTTPTFATGWQLLGVLSVSTDYQATAYKTVSATGAYSVTGTTGGQWMAAIVTYR